MLILVTELLLGREGGLPVLLQGAGDQPVGRIDAFIASPCQRGLVGGPFQALLPLSMQPPPFELDVLGGGFKWSSQHGLCDWIGGTGPEPRQVFSSRASFAACC